METAIQQAMVQRLHGIMVTQVGHTSYTVALSRDVPYGQTHELRQWASES